MRTSPIKLDAISVVEFVNHFAEAIELASELLVTSGHAEGPYVRRVLDNFEKLGPYFVVAPQIAIAHASPGQDVLFPGLSLLKLNQPVVSGSQENDPVALVFALCTPDSQQHIELLGEFANLMSDPGIVNSLLKASAESVIREILQS